MDQSVLRLNFSRGKNLTQYRNVNNRYKLRDILYINIRAKTRISTRPHSILSDDITPDQMPFLTVPESTLTRVATSHVKPRVNARSRTYIFPLKRKREMIDAAAARTEKPIARESIGSMRNDKDGVISSLRAR